MAQLAGIVCSSPESRKLFLERSRAQARSFAGLEPANAEFGDLSLDWALPAGAPHSRTSVHGEEALRLGRPGGTFGVRAARTADGGVTVEADPMGLFPVYYRASADRLVFASSPSLFRFDPEFRAKLDLEGLTALLFVNISITGNTLLEGVRRLPAGRALSWKPGNGVSEIKTRPSPLSDKYFGNSFEQNLEIVDGLLAETVEKEKDAYPPLMLLSGGLDSRLLAGYMGRIFSRKVRAVTQGDARDFEMQCASRVASAMGWEQERVAIDPASFEASAFFKIDHEHLTHGFITPYFTQLALRVGPQNALVFAGVHGDQALGFGTVSQLAIQDGGHFPFESTLKRLNKSGFAAERIHRLLSPCRPDGALERVTENMRSAYGSAGGKPFQNAWQFEVFLADRLQVGFIPRMLAFSAWPVVPFIDHALISAVSGMPFEHLRDRRMERELICRRFQKLAVLPLDRNSYDISPVYGLKRTFVPGGLTLPQILRCAAGHARARLVKQAGRARGAPDRRFYYQTMDVNSEAWRAFRRRAEGSRHILENFFDREVLAECWPGPEVPVQAQDGITDVQGLKLLLGLAVWAQRHL